MFVSGSQLSYSANIFFPQAGGIYMMTARDQITLSKVHRTAVVSHMSHGLLDGREVGQLPQDLSVQDIIQCKSARNKYLSCFEVYTSLVYMLRQRSCSLAYEHSDKPK